MSLLRKKDKIKETQIPLDKKSKMAIISIKVTVKVTRTLTLASF